MLVAHSSVSPDTGVFTGREAVGRWFGDWFRAFGKDYRFEVEEAQSVGDRVLVVARHHGRGRTSGAGVEGMTANVDSVREGKIGVIVFSLTLLQAQRETYGVAEAAITPVD